MKRKLLFNGVTLLAIFLLLFSAYKLMNSRTIQFFGGLTSQVETDEKVVALTFDDGPTENVYGLLGVLEKHNVKATFFLIGREIVGYPKEIHAIIEAGHQIGNHSYSHERMVFKSPSFIKTEIEKTDQFIRDAGYEGEIDFRPPNGKKLIALPYHLSKNKKDTIMWNLEPDRYDTTPAEKVNYIKENITKGSIILMHPMYDTSGNELEAIEGIIKALTEEGFRFMTVNELQELRKKGVSPPAL